MSRVRNLSEGLLNLNMENIKTPPIQLATKVNSIYMINTNTRVEAPYSSFPFQSVISQCFVNFSVIHCKTKEKIHLSCHHHSPHF